MGTATAGGTYTAKLLDGPLEGRTVAAKFLDNGTPQGRIVLPANDRGKKYVYRRNGDISEFADGTGAPGAVDYAYFGAEFD
ncbi:hypothetical protein GCM10022286_30120 [Gryllotalpicola daejeonensis]|uniref:Uncharacterized protein n=1 Tax=Gryllotalpicola daejeonensis TaxID=993087 RepID=A0ABP7ZNL7_9MICO